MTDMVQRQDGQRNEHGASMKETFFLSVSDVRSVRRLDVFELRGCRNVWSIVMGQRNMEMFSRICIRAALVYVT